VFQTFLARKPGHTNCEAVINPLGFSFDLQYWRSSQVKDIWMATINSHCFLCHVQYKRCHKGSGGLEKKSGGRHPHGHWCALHVVDTPPPQISPMITQGVQMSPGIRWNRILGVSWSERDLFFSRNYCTGLDQKIWNELRKEKKWVNWTKKLCGDKTVQQNPALVGKSLVPWLQGFNGVHVIDLRCLAAERRSLSGNFGELDPYVVLIYSIKVSHAKIAVSSIPLLVGKVQGFLFLGLYKSHR